MERPPADEDPETRSKDQGKGNKWTLSPAFQGIVQAAELNLPETSSRLGFLWVQNPISTCASYKSDFIETIRGVF